MLTPVRGDEYLAWVHFFSYFHPFIILGIHAAEALKITKARGQVLPKVVRRAILVKVFEIRAEENCWVIAVKASRQRVLLEEGDVHPEFVTRE
jgi:hypothetical protein